jgi:hypothetical protein
MLAAGTARSWSGAAPGPFWLDRADRFTAGRATRAA